MLLKYLDVSTQYQIKRTLDINWLPDIGSFLIADNSKYFSWIGSWVKDVPYRSDQQLFVGVGVISILLLGAWGRYKGKFNAHSKLFALSLALLVSATICISETSFYSIIIHIPGVHAIRIVSRVIILMMSPISFLVAISIFNLVEKNKTHEGWVLLIVAAILSIDVITHTSVRTSISESRNRVSDISINLDLIKAKADKKLY